MPTTSGLVADKVFALEAPAFEILWAGVFAFAIQIYADFSAYSDIARGTARWFGFELMVNFNHPYLARGPQDFWRRWHISLSTWFRDYVYIPLGGSRKGFGRELANILATFVLSGFWHGASWNYVLWGFYHGMLLVASRLRRRVLGDQRPDWMAVFTPLQIAGTFVLVCIGWLMFRETDITMLMRDLTLSPEASSPLERQAGYALILRVLPYAAPLLVQSLWVEIRRDRARAGVAGDRRRPAGGAAVCGDPGVPQPGVAGFHLFPVLRRGGAEARATSVHVAQGFSPQITVRPGMWAGL